MNFVKYSITLLLLTMLVVSCDTQALEDAIDDFGIIIGLEPINTSGSVQILDAATEVFVQTDVQVTYEQGEIIDMFSDPVQSVTVKNGVLVFGIPNNYTPTESNPYEITMTLTAEGYLPSTQTVALTGTDENDFSLSLVSITNPPAGVEVQEEEVGGTSDTGETTSDIKVDTSSDPNEGETEESTKLGINIPAGSVLTDENGNTLTGALTASTEYYDSSTEQGYDAIPEEIKKTSAESNEAILGLSSILITDRSGRKAVRVGGGATKNGSTLAQTGCYDVQMNVAADVVNRFRRSLIFYAITSNNNVDFSIAILDEAVSQDPNNPTRSIINVEVCDNFATTYLLSAVNSVSIVGTINLERNGNSGAFDLEAFKTGSSVKARFRSNQNRLDLSGFLRGEYNVKVTNGIITKEVPNNFEDNTSLTITLDSPPPTLIDAQITLNLVCSDRTTYLRYTSVPTTQVYFRKIGTNSWRRAQSLQFNFDDDLGALTSASVTVTSVEQGAEYEFWVVSQDISEKKIITITGPVVEEEYEITDGDICS